MAPELKLGNDPVLAPNGIDATGQMEDEGIEPQQVTDFVVRITNNSSTPIPNLTVVVKKKAGSVALNTPSLPIPRLDVGETEELHFQVRNPTNSVQTKYTFGVQTSYFGSITNSYKDFVRG